MKKIIFLFAMVFAVSMAMAQNSSTVDQSGDGNGATVNQTGENESVIDQSTWGTGHSAVVTQVQNLAGDKNFSDIFQDQRGAEVDVNQEGASNISGIKQSGPNTADIDQVGVGNVLGNYTSFTGRAFQKNGTSFPGDNNQLWVTQTGDDNKAGVWQEHHATADIDQLGDDNKAVVYQTGDREGELNTARLDVIGNNNQTEISQIGDNNRAYVEAGHYGDVSANNNQAYLEQVGYLNQFEVDIVDGDNNYIDASQTSGDYNHFRLRIRGDENTINMTAVGSHNKGSWVIEQPTSVFSSNNTLDISQSGEGNFANGKIAGNSNDVDITQSGENNEIGTLWYGSGTYMEFDGVNIVGDLNDVDISQTGMGHSSLNSVVGDSNVISVTQSN